MRQELGPGGRWGPAAEGPTALRAWPVGVGRGKGRTVARGSDPGVPQDQASWAEVAGPRDRRGGMRWQWSREAGEDGERLGRLGPHWEKAREVRGGWVPAGLTDP